MIGSRCGLEGHMQVLDVSCSMQLRWDAKVLRLFSDGANVKVRYLTVGVRCRSELQPAVC